MDIITKNELELYKQQITDAHTFGAGLQVKNDADYLEATMRGKAIKEKLELIVKRKEEITKPLNASIKSVRDLFKPIETAAEESLFIIKQKMLAFVAEKERKVVLASQKLDARVEKGTISQAEANVKKFMNEIPKTVATDTGSATVKKVKKYYVIDKSKVPLDFLEVDMVKVKASFKAGFPVSGTEERLENELALN